LAETHRALGDVLASNGDPEEAMKSYRDGLQAVEAIPEAVKTSAQAAVLHLSLRADLGLEELDVRVLEVLPGGQAEKVGLRKGDTISRYGEQKITALSQLTQLIAASKGPYRELEIRRDGKPLTVRVGEGKLGARFEERSISVSTRESR